MNVAAHTETKVSDPAQRSAYFSNLLADAEGDTPYLQD